MFDRRLVIFALAAGVAVHGAQAQGDPTAAALRARFDAASARGEELDRKLLKLNAEAFAATAPDSITAGTLIIRLAGRPVDADVRAVLDRAARSAWDSLSQFAGAEAAAIAAARPIDFNVHRYGSPERIRGAALSFPGSNGSINYLPWPFREEAARKALFDLLGKSAVGRASTAFATWTAGWVAVTPPGPLDFSEVAYALATSPSSFSHDCIHGALAACSSILEIASDTSLDLMHRWYRPADWRAIVAGWNPQDADHQALARRCVRQHDLDACERAAFIAGVPKPAPASAKFLLTTYAVSTGGDGALARLLSNTGTPAQAIAAAAGKPIDVVIAGWQQEVIAAAPESSMPSLAQGGMIIAWSLLFGAVAMRRRP